MKKDVAVIILNWNSAPLLRRYLPGVLQNTNPDMADVIVADNGSTDASRQVLEEEFPQVPTILLDKNYGYAEGYNKSIAQATGYKYTVLLNSDVRTPQGWLEPLYRYMDEHPQVGAVQPKVLQDRDDGRQVFDYAGAAGGYLDKHGYPYCRGRLFSTIEDDHGQYDSAQGADVFWASGACLMVRTALYREVGGLDSAFFAHMEEIDLCWRIWRSGHRISLVTGSSIYHLGAAACPRATRSRPISTSATTCSCSTRTCLAARAGECCWCAASTTRLRFSSRSPPCTLPTPRPSSRPTTTFGPCARATATSRARTCCAALPRGVATSS